MKRARCLLGCISLLWMVMSPLAAQSQSMTEEAAKPMKAEMAQSMMGMDHSHMPIAVPTGMVAPRLSLALSKDLMTGYNLQLTTQHYIMSPPPEAKDMAALMVQHIDDKSGYLEGHAHLYINGVKIQRLYGRDLHLPGKLFEPGINSISVTLNDHAHRYWTHLDKKIIATLYIDGQAADQIKYKFESFPVKLSQ